MKVKKLENSCYIVQNEENNKVLKLGESEFKYLQALREKNGTFKSESAMTEEQQRYLFQKFEKLGFLDDETNKVKDKQNLSNVILISFGFYEKLYNVLKILGCFVSPAGFFLFLGAFLGTGISFFFYTDIIMYGVTHISLDLKTVIILCIMVLATAVIHEVFHAVACYKYTGAIGGMGIKLFYLMPVFYTDVSTVYLTDNRKKMLVVSAAGLMCNVFLGGVSLVIYIFMYLQGTYCKIFFYYFVFQFATILRNILPFEKFDGYWMIVSISGIHNLYDKSIVLFFAMLRDLKGYSAIPVNYLKKIMLSLYGGINLLFRWIFWLYCIGALSRFVQDYMSYWISYVVVRILYAIIALNTIMFVRRYVIKYKTEGNRIIANL